MSDHKSTYRLAVGVTLLAAAALLAQGCTTRSRTVAQEKTKATSGASNPMERQLDQNSYCVQVMTMGPPLSTPVHFSNKQSSSDGSAKDFEADLLGDKFDLTFHERHPATDMDRELNKIPGAKPSSIVNGFAESEQISHFTRSDESGWRVGGSSVALGGTPWGLFIAKPVVTQVGTESINGTETIKFAVDTKQQSQADKWPSNLGWGTKDYNITGSAWVTKDTGCILQYAIDLEKDHKDGTVEKTHYEGATSKQ